MMSLKVQTQGHRHGEQKKGIVIVVVVAFVESIIATDQCFVSNVWACFLFLTKC